MKKTVLIEIEKEVLVGDVLDIGFKNHGIIYSVCKLKDEEVAVDYQRTENDHIVLNRNKYDTCVMFFSLNGIFFDVNRSKLLKSIWENLNNHGVIHIWDVDKEDNRIIDMRIRVAMPDGSNRKFKVKDYNLLKKASYNKTLKLLEPYFNITKSELNDNIYYIRADKKE